MGGHHMSIVGGTTSREEYIRSREKIRAEFGTVNIAALTTEDGSMFSLRPAPCEPV